MAYFHPSHAHAAKRSLGVLGVGLAAYAADDAYAADAAAAAARASALKKAADLVRGLISCAEVEAAINGTKE